MRDSISSYKNQIDVLKAYNTEITDALVKNTFEIGKFEDLHDFVSTDTSRSYDQVSRIIAMKPFEKLSEEQRRFLTTFYTVYIVQAQSNLRRLRMMYKSNESLIAMVNKELDK